MFTLIAESEGPDRLHRKVLDGLVEEAKGTIRIASAYVTDARLLSGTKLQDIRLLTYLSRLDIVAGATSLKSLATLIKAGVHCRYISNGPRLHAKVYVIGDETAVVSSANLTESAFDRNIEVGVHLSGAAVQPIVTWFDKLWHHKAVELDLATVSKLQQETKAARIEFSSMRKTIQNQSLLPAKAATTLSDLFNTANQFFVCNTNRRGAFDDEKRMRDRRYAVAWEAFHYPGHMEKVAEGDAILMYAKGVGIIGIGRAEGPCQMLEPHDPDSVTPRDTGEWRVPVAWLAWVEPDNAYRWPKINNATFFDVSTDKYWSRRDGVMKHFLSLPKNTTATP